MAGNGVILIGGGGHAKVVLDALRAGGIAVAGFLDDRDDCPLAGTLERLGGLNHRPDGAAIVAVGDVGLRRRLIEGAMGTPYADAIAHRSAVVSPSASQDEGAFVGPGAIINAGARIGAHAIINSGAIVEHDCVVGINTHIAPGAVLGGGVAVGDHTLVGLGARVLPGVRVGARCVIGAGAVVLGDVGDGETVVGVWGRTAAR